MNGHSLNTGPNARLNSRPGTRPNTRVDAVGRPKPNTITAGLCRGIGLVALMGVMAGMVAGCGGGTTPPPSGGPLPAPSPPTLYSIGGTVTGLTGTLVLQNNGGDDRTISADGAFTFSTSLPNSATYSATVKTQPGSPPQTCAIANGTGTVTAANVTSISVTCVSIPLALSSSTPASGTTNVDRSAALTLLFSRNLDASTATNANITLSSSSGAQSIGIVVVGSQVTITPSTKLLPATTYTLTVGTGVHGSAGELLASASTINFVTKVSAVGEPTLIESSDAGNASTPQVAIDSAGNALAVWSQTDGTSPRIYYNRYTPGSGWGSPTLIAPGINAGSTNAINPRIAMNANGDALLVWTQTDDFGIVNGSPLYRNRVWSARYTAGNFESPITLSVGTVNAYFPKVAINDAGEIAVAWHQIGVDHPEAWTRRYFSGSWDIPRAVQSDFSYAAMYPDIALSKNGIATVSWEQSDGTRFQAWANRSNGNTAWHVATRLENSVVYTGVKLDTHVATDAAGNAIVIWRQLKPSISISEIWSATFRNNTWSAPTVVSTDPTYSSTEHQIAMDDAGNAFVLFSKSSLTTEDLYAARYTPSAGWNAPVLIDNEEGFIGSAPQIAMTPSGIAQVVWTQYRSSTRYDVLTSRYTSSGWESPLLIGNTDTNAGQSASVPSVTINAGSIVQVVWLRTDGIHLNVWANGFE